MAKRVIAVSLIATLCFAVFAVKPRQSSANSNEDLTAEKLVSSHLKSLGNEKLLSKVESRMFVGTTEVKFIQGANWTLKGNSMFVSQGPKLGIVMRYMDTNYPGEYFAYDGKEVTVANIRPGEKSPLASFLYRFTKIMKGGYMGGALSTSWPLLDNRYKDADMKCRKVVKENRELYELEYRPKNGLGDMKIRFYFDPKTYQHVRTEYKVKNRDDASVNSNYIDAASSLVGEIGQAREDSFYTLVEKFEDYKKVAGLVLPYRYTLEYSQEGGAGSFIAHWTMNVVKWAVNAPNLDPKLFQAHK